jgi:RNA polymerase sigma-70 factor (ECF subfamily)
MTLSDYNDCVDEHADGLYRFILKQVKDKDAAKDIVQDSFEKLWLKVKTVDAAKAKSYLFTTAYHCLVDYTRQLKKKGKLEEIKPSDMQSPAGNPDIKSLLEKGLDQLPEIQKTVLLLRDYEGYDYEEIGKITQLSESQVKVYIFRGRAFLKNYIGKLDVIL